jgi:23S rRNA (uracil1939-C5)-methyltransferase
VRGRSRQPTGRRAANAAPVRVVIDSIAAGGEGVGRLPDGRAIFVHRTAPGETVEAGVTTERPRWARGRLVRVLEPSSARRDPPCPHYAECGGCTIEHLRYEEQLRVKSRIVADALQRIGGLPLPPPGIVASPLEHRYRNRVSFTLHRAGSDRVVAGFHALHEPTRVVPVDGRCLLPEEPIGPVWDALRGAWGPAANRLPSGERLRLTLRATAGRDVSLLVEGGYSPGRPEELLPAVAGLASIWHRPDRRGATLLAGAPGLPETWGEETFTLGGTAFLQVNRGTAALLEDHVFERAVPVAGQHVVDAYCGLGIHARRLARAGAAVTGIELDAGAVAAAARASPGGRFVAARVEDALGDVLPADLLILNPPRAGVAPAALRTLLAVPPPRIIYVSCDPATLARDLRTLAPAYAVRDLRCFDMFPQTAHVETVAELAHTRPETEA